MRFLILTTILLALQACGQEPTEASQTQENEMITALGDSVIIDTSGKILQTRFNPPTGFQRVAVDSNSFAHYLRNLPLKPAGSSVLLYNGSEKPNFETYDAVVDLKIGKRDLHQCADAVMRLKAEYLWQSGQYDKIHFNFTNGFRVDYSEWMKGKRMVVKGNKTYWVNGSPRTNNYQSFWKYMELIFNYAGTLSLEKELNPKDIKDLKIGDVFIRGGSPGHAIIVVDLIENPTTGEKRFMLAQSYMPAQETQILQNPNANAMGPWYSTDIGSMLYTPEWSFDADQLRGW